jgi:hypothetical protein
MSLALVFSMVIATDLLWGRRVPPGTIPWRSAGVCSYPASVRKLLG